MSVVRYWLGRAGQKFGVRNRLPLSVTIMLAACAVKIRHRKQLLCEGARLPARETVSVVCAVIIRRVLSAVVMRRASVNGKGSYFGGLGGS